MFSFTAEVISKEAMLEWADLKNQDGEDVSFHKNPLLLFKQLWDGLRNVVSSYPQIDNTQICTGPGTTMAGQAKREQAHFGKLSKINLHLLIFLRLSAWRTIFLGESIIKLWTPFNAWMSFFLACSQVLKIQLLKHDVLFLSCSSVMPIFIFHLKH